MFLLSPISSFTKWLGTWGTEPSHPAGPAAGGLGGVSDSLGPESSHNIISLTAYSVRNLADWARYGIKLISNKIFPAPFSIHKENFISFVNQEKKTEDEKMALFNSVIALSLEIPGNHEKDLAEIIAVIAAKVPEKFKDFTNKLQEINDSFRQKIATKSPDKQEIALLQEWVQESGMAGFLAMKQAMFHYYLDLATLRVDRTHIQWPEKRAFAFYQIASSREFRTIVEKLENQPIKNNIIEACIQILEAPAGSQLADFAKILIELDQSQVENQRFGLYALTRKKDDTGKEIPVNKPHADIVKEWIKSDLFSLDLFKAAAERHLFSITNHVFESDIDGIRKVDSLKFIIKHASSTSLKIIIKNFRDHNPILFDLVAGEIIKLNETEPAFIVPAPQRENDTPCVYDWFQRDEEFGDKIVDGVKTRVDNYKPKKLILLRGIHAFKIRKQREKTISKMRPGHPLTRAELNEVVNELHTYALTMEQGTYPENMKKTYEAEIRNVFEAAYYNPFFSDLAKAIIDMQCRDASIHKRTAGELEQKISAHPSSPESRADQEDSLKYGITKKVFEGALTSYIKQGRYTKMQEDARNLILSNYIASNEVDWTFIKDGIKLWIDANYLDATDPNSLAKMKDVVPAYSLSLKDNLRNKANELWKTFV